MNGLPPFPLFLWARSTPVLVVNGHVWLAAIRQLKLRSTLRLEGLTCGLLPAQSLEEMGRDYFSECAREIEFWQAVKLGQEEKTAASICNLRGQAEEIDTIIFLCNRLIPRIRQLRSEPEDWPPMDTGAANAVKERLEQLTGRVNEPPPGFSSLLSDLPTTESSRRKDSWGLIEGKLYHVVRRGAVPRRERPPHATNTVTLPDGSYCLRAQRVSAATIRTRFQKALADLITEHARKYIPESVTLVREVREALEPLERRLRAFQEDCEQQRSCCDGLRWRVFRWRRGRWYLGIRIVPYALEGPDGQLYRFDSTTVAIAVDPKGRPTMPEATTERYEHPFTPSDGSRICMGDYTETSAMRRLSSLAPEDKLLQFLMDARNTLVAGYHQHNGLTPYRNLSDFPHRRITREQAAKEMLPVYPYYRS